MSGAAWTASAVRERIIEAAETLLRSPFQGGGGSYWPEYVLDYSRGVTLRSRPSAAEISRMEEVWQWINSWLPQADRKLIYSWARYRAIKGRTLSELAEREEMSPRTLNWQINRICKAIAYCLNRRMGAVCVPASVDGVAENLAYESADSVGTIAPKQKTRWMAPDAKPRHDPDSPELQALIKRLERQNHRREKARRAQPADSGQAKSSSPLRTGGGQTADIRRQRKK